MQFLVMIFFYALAEAAAKADPKVIPMGEVQGMKIVLAWLTENEQRTYFFAMFLLFAGREVYGFIKIKFGKVGIQLEGLKEVPHHINKIQSEQREQGEDIKDLIKAFNKFDRDVDARIRDEVRYAMDLKERRKQ